MSSIPELRCDELAAIADDDVIDAFHAHGIVLVRGAPFDAHACDAFARRFTASYFLGYGRAPFADLPAITVVNETPLPLAAHTDNGIRPEEQRPDITWFLCERPAADGGETTFFDGVRIWEALSPATRGLLLERRVCFHMRMSWQAMRLPDRAAFERFVTSQNGAIVGEHADGSLDVEIAIAPVRRTRWSDELAFTSSLALAGTPGFEALRVSLEGEPDFPVDVRAEIDAALDACMQELSWLPGDVVMLDNTRFLHGRHAIRDPNRRHYLIQTLRASFS